MNCAPSRLRSYWWARYASNLGTGTGCAAGPEPRIMTAAQIVQGEGGRTAPPTAGAVKRDAGGYVWEVTVGESAAAKVGFHGATPTVQRAGAAQAAVTYTPQTISDPPMQVQVQAKKRGSNKNAAGKRARRRMV